MKENVNLLISEMRYLTGFLSKNILILKIGCMEYDNTVYQIRLRVFRAGKQAKNRLFKRKNTIISKTTAKILSNFKCGGHGSTKLHNIPALQPTRKVYFSLI